MAKPFFRFLTIALSIVYLGELFIVWVNQCLLNKALDLFCFLIPLLIIVGQIILMISSKVISETIYSLIFTLGGTFLGYLLYTLHTAILLRVVMIFVEVPETLGLLILYGTPLLIIIYGIINAKITKLVKITLKYPDYKEKIRILHLSDIHLGALHQLHSSETIVSEVRDLDPDIVVITGDLADGTLKVKEEWLKPFDTLNMPILYVTGNHEEMNPYQDMIDVVNKTQIKHIGKHENFSYKGINFLGEDFRFALPYRLKDAKIKEGVPNVLLYHIPEMRPEELKDYGIFLLLAGHTHGGQIWPFQIPAYLSNSCFSGLYSDKENKHHVYVSSGVNNAVCPMRIGSRRVFALITIEGCTEKNN